MKVALNFKTKENRDRYAIFLQKRNIEIDDNCSCGRTLWVYNVPKVEFSERLNKMLLSIDIETSIEINVNDVEYYEIYSK